MLKDWYVWNFCACTTFFQYFWDGWIWPWPLKSALQRNESAINFLIICCRLSSLRILFPIAWSFNFASLIYIHITSISIVIGANFFEILSLFSLDDRDQILNFTIVHFLFTYRKFEKLFSNGHKAIYVKPYSILLIFFCFINDLW